MLVMELVRGRRILTCKKGYDFKGGRVGPELNADEQDTRGVRMG
jgi:hypothetical protein